MKTKFAILLPVVSGAMWASIGIFVRLLASEGFNNITILSLRVIFASVLLFFIILFKNKSLFRIKPSDIWIFFGGGTITTLGLNYSYNVAINTLTLAQSAVLLAMCPVFAVIMSAIFFKEKITKSKVFFMCLTIFGCILASGIVGEDSVSFKSVGVIFGLCAALFYSFTGVFSKVAINKGYQPLTMTFYGMFILAVMIIPFTNWGMVSDYVATAPLKNISFLIFQAFCTVILPYLAYNIGLVAVNAGTASILAAGAEPSAAMIFGIVFFSEIPTLVSFIGLVITVASLTTLCKINVGKEG